MRTMRNQFTELKKRYGSHGKVAELIGISPRQYARIRRGEFPLKKAVAFLMEDLLRRAALKELIE